MSNLDLAILFFLQLGVILLACRLVGLLAVRVGQPQVVAEMIAGVLLGPSFLGLVFPGLQAWLFPWDPAQEARDTQSYLFPASQLGLALYMFLIGLEFRIDVMRAHYRCSLAVSVAGMVTPFLLGAGLAWFLWEHTSLFPERTIRIEAMLFLGASMCITAFPMLARILREKGLHQTRMGTVAIGAAAIDDATAWCLLALVLATFERNAWLAFEGIGGGIAYLGVMWMVVRPAMARLESWMVRDGSLTDSGLAVALALMAFGACFTDRIGLHAVFGAFVAGAVLPRGVVARELTERLQPVTVVLFLPLFFTYSGLNTQIELLNSTWLWLMGLAVLAVAVIGKGVACALAAWWSGTPPRDAVGIGVLMNARGLMELIIINIGLQRGVISKELFAILVLMAIITTLMASPLFERLVRPTKPSGQP